MKSDFERLFAFYLEGGPDHRGRTLDAILSWDDAALEAEHDYIQWLFPNPTPSRAQPGSPVLPNGEIAELFNRDVGRRNLDRSLDRMLRFYGLTRDKASVCRGENWKERARNWATSPTHNDLRITRILICLTLAGRQADARGLLAFLENAFSEDGARRAALRHWRTAAQ